MCHFTVPPRQCLSLRFLNESNITNAPLPKAFPHLFYIGAIQPLLLPLRVRCSNVMCWNRAISPSLIHLKDKPLLPSLAHVHTEPLTRNAGLTTTAVHPPTAAHPKEAGLGAGRGGRCKS